LYVIQNLVQAQDATWGRVDVEERNGENDVISFAGMLMLVAERLLQHAKNGVPDPFAVMPKNDNYPNEVLKLDFLQQIDTIQTMVAGDLNNGNRASDQMLRQGSMLNQPATLPCPYCGEPINTSIGVRVLSDSASKNPPSMKVSVFEGQQGNQTGKITKCPKCKRQVKAQLQVGADAVGSDTLSIRVRLDQNTAVPRGRSPFYFVG